MFISVEVGVPGTERKYCRRSEEGEVTIIWSVLGGLLGGGLVLGHENWEECGEGGRRGKEQGGSRGYGCIDVGDATGDRSVCPGYNPPRTEGSRRRRSKGGRKPG